MLTIQNAYFVSFNAATVPQVLALANSDVATNLSHQSDTFKVDVAPIIVLPDAGGFTAVLTYKTTQINMPIATNLL